jgi:hypothetical protein
MASRSVEITLEYPVDWKGRQVSAITLRRPKGRDFRYLPEGDNVTPQDMFPFFAQLMSVGGEQLTEEFIEEMDGADINAVSETATGFLAKAGRKTPSRRPGAR